MAEDDLDRADQNLRHARANIDVALQGLDLKLSTYTDKLETKVDRVAEEAEEGIDGLKKILVGVLVSVTTLAIAIVFQVLVTRGGG